MRAVKPGSFILAAVAVAAGLNESWALPAAIVGFLLSLIPLATAPKLVPVRDHENGVHAGTTYRLHNPMSPQHPGNQTPDDPFGRG